MLRIEQCGESSIGCVEQAQRRAVMVTFELGRPALGGNVVCDNSARKKRSRYILPSNFFFDVSLPRNILYAAIRSQAWEGVQKRVVCFQYIFCGDQEVGGA